MALTAIVISFAVSALLLALAYRSYALTRDDAVQDDVEDPRIAGALGGAEQGATADARPGTGAGRSGSPRRRAGGTVDAPATPGPVNEP